MGADYVTCWGGDRGKEAKMISSSSSLYSRFTDSWKHDQLGERMMVTVEEAHMIKKQQGLNIHFIPCEKIKSRFQLVCSTSIHQDIDQTEFCAILAASKLLKADFPTKDERWFRFYSKFVIMDQVDPSRPWRKRYSLIPTQAALIFLSQGSHDTKAKAICELFSGDQFVNPGPSGISKYNYDGPLEANCYEDKLEQSALSSDQLKCIISIFVNLSLVLLPLYASDFPLKDRRNYYKLLVQWTKRSQQVIDHYIGEFYSGSSMNSRGTGGSISMRQFIDKCLDTDVFNVMRIREVAKRTAVIQNVNPMINRQTALEQDLFGGQLSQEELNDGIEEDLTDLPEMFSDAVLYKVVHTIDQQLSQTQKVSRKEQRRYLDMQSKKSINRPAKQKSQRDHHRY